MEDPRFWLLKEALASYAADPDDPPPTADFPLQAAVSLVVRGRDDLDLLLIKRARREGDPWSGHMALPGGRRDDTDPGLIHTAVRETHEETGVRLGEGFHLGRLEEVSPVGTKLPRLTIHPFVFGVPPSTAARVASPELQAVHWVSLAELRDPDNAGEVGISLPEGGERDFPCLRVAGEVVWGLTYRILRDFLEIYPDGALPPLRGSDSPPTRR